MKAEAEKAKAERKDEKTVSFSTSGTGQRSALWGGTSTFPFSLSVLPALSLSAFCFLLSAFPVCSANSNPYNGIVDRNVFSLKPKLIQEELPKEQPKPPVKLTLTGITTILGNKRVLLSAQIPARPPEQAKTENYMLTEGQRDGGVEVISIDEKGGKVVVNNNGITETLDFVNNGAKLTVQAQTISRIVPAPSALSGAPGNTSNPLGSFPQPPTRNLGTTPQPDTNAAGTGMSTALGYSAPSSAPQQILSREQQEVLIELNRIRRQESGDPTARILPPTTLTPVLNEEQELPQ
jgi:hypothetical protein